MGSICCCCCCYDDPVKESAVPWTVFRYGEDMEMQAFQPMDGGVGVGGGETQLRSFPELRGKQVTIRGCSFPTWMVVFNDTLTQFSLFNLLTRHSITLPPLTNTEHQEEEVHWVLTAPPPGKSSSTTTSNSFLLVFETTNVRVCNLGSDEYFWRLLRLDDEIVERLGGSEPMAPVSCGGKIYAQFEGMINKVLVIEQVEPLLVAHILETDCPSGPLEACLSSMLIMMESNGELFRIYVAHGGIGLKEVVGVEVYRLDLSSKKWVKPKTLEGRALFFDERFWLYPPSTGREQLVKSNCVYFFHHHTLYSFNLETNGLISYALPEPPINCNNCQVRCSGLVLLSTDTSRVPSELEMKLEISKMNGIEKKGEANSSGSSSSSSTLDRLPLDLVLEISRHLPAPGDRLSFRAVNRKLRSAMPSTWLTDSLKEERACFSQPWLLTCRKDMDAYTLIDPWHGDRYFMTLGDDDGSHPTDAAMIYCNGSWCMMVQATRSIFLWNPFTKEKITFPKCPHQWRSIAACAFTNSPHSPDFHIMLLCVCQGIDHKVKVYIDEFEHGKWWSDMDMDDEWMNQHELPPIFQSTLCLSYGFYWLLDSHTGMVWHMGGEKDSIPETLWNLSVLPILPDYKRSYLVACGTDLLAVISTTSMVEDDVHVFKLDIHKAKWFAVNNLDDYVLYISHFSSFSMPVTIPGEGNRIYFPRLYDGKLVYYSLQSRRYHHCLGGEPVSTVLSSSAGGGFQQGTEDQILSAWIQPKFF